VLAHLGAEQLSEDFVMPFCKPLHLQELALVAVHGQDRHQRHQPLREAHLSAYVAVRQRIEEADQICCSSLI
jgi:hypothetical protein